MNTKAIRTSTRRTGRGVCAVAALMAAAVITAAAPLGQAATLHVSANQTNDPPDGASWMTAFPMVTQALNVATNGDSVWIAEGTYFEGITLSNGIALYGGFKGDETFLDQRDWNTNLTILDGGRSNRVITVEWYATNTTRIDGLVIQNGHTNIGGGIICSLSSPTIVNNQIRWNTATNYGGGIYFTGAFSPVHSPLIASNLIQGNVVVTSLSGGGGGIAARYGGSPRILNNRIIANSTSSSSFGFFADGVMCWDLDHPEIVGNFISANGPSAAGLAIEGGTNATVINNTITWNGAWGLYCNAISAVIANNIIAHNQGGILGIKGMDVRNNCIFDNGTDVSGFEDPAGTNGNISIDPGLVQDPYRPELHLAGGSPCIDAGDSSLVTVALDIDGAPRVTGAAVDIGADEFDPAYVPAPPAILHVSQNGSDAADGMTWAAAKRTIQAALNDASITGGEVWVAAGSHTNNLLLRPFAFLYGGFAGTETNRSERDWMANPTILDGGQAGSVVTASSLFHWGAIDGFIIRNGLAANGAGIHCSRSSLSIANNMITNNHAVGAGGAGGGIALFSSSSSVTDNIIAFNTASVGGGIACANSGSSPVITRNIIDHNLARSDSSGAGFAASGGGGLFAFSSATPLVRGNYLANNIATNTSGGLSSGKGGAVCVDSGARPQILNNTMLTNIASSTHGLFTENGGGIYSSSPHAVIANNIIAFGSSGIQTFKVVTDTNFQNVQHNCVFGNATNYLRMPDLTGTNGNISMDPLLAADGIHLTPDSPCINAGTTNFALGDTDFDGNPRVVAGSVDIGAHEFQSPSSVISYAWLQHFGLPTDGSADFAHSDADSHNNYQEWKAWTNPTNELSHLRMLNPEPGTNGTVVRWQSVAGQSYFVERANDAGQSFSVIQSNVTGQAGMTSFADTNTVNSGAALYRVGVPE